MKLNIKIGDDFVMKIKNLILVSTCMIGIMGCSHENKPKTITEYFTIKSIDKDNYVHGEIIKPARTGEGIYYSVKELKDAGLKDIFIGKDISVTWTEGNYDNENWDNIYSSENIPQYTITKNNGDKYEAVYSNKKIDFTINDVDGMIGENPIGVKVEKINGVVYVK